MGLPALLGELDQEVVEAVAAMPSREKGQAPIEDLSDLIKVTEHLLAGVRPILVDITAEVERAARAVGADAGKPIELAIERVGANEASLTQKFLPVIDTARKLRAQTFGARHLSREEKARHAIVLDRSIRTSGEILKLFRDARWGMLALRAELEPAGDAPVFSDPNELLEYLQANRK